MGPYAPQLDYAAVGNFDNGRQLNCGHPTDTEIVCPALLPPPPALQSGDLPASGGFPAGFPGNNNANANQQSWFPQQYWPNENRGTINPPNLNCSPGSSTFQPTIDFVATQFQTQVRQQGEPAHSYPYCQNQDTTGSPNHCVQVFNQLPQTELNAYQPPLPITIVGQGFGYLSGLPWVGTDPPDLVIYDETTGWNTTNTLPGLGYCQIYISDWTDGSISFQVGLPVGVTDDNGNVTVSPLTDMSPITFFQPTSNKVYCPIAYNDYISVTVTNDRRQLDLRVVLPQLRMLPNC